MGFFDILHDSRVPLLFSKLYYSILLTNNAKYPVSYIRPKQNTLKQWDLPLLSPKFKNRRRRSWIRTGTWILSPTLTHISAPSGVRSGRTGLLVFNYAWNSSGNIDFCGKSFAISNFELEHLSASIYENEMKRVLCYVRDKRDACP